jgi:hypothetical protein
LRPPASRSGQHRSEARQFFGFHAGVVFRALGAIAAILRAAAGLDRKQRGDLHLSRIEIFPVDTLRVEDEIGKWQREQHAHFLTRPVVADATQIHRCGKWSCFSVSQGHPSASVCAHHKELDGWNKPCGEPGCERVLTGLGGADRMVARMPHRNQRSPPELSDFFAVWSRLRVVPDGARMRTLLDLGCSGKMLLRLRAQFARRAGVTQPPSHFQA